MAGVKDEENFWKGTFGNQYADRNIGAKMVAANTAFFGKALGLTHGVHRILELGTNIGLNLAALDHLFPKAELSGVEINEKAASHLKKTLPKVDLHRMSILEFKPGKQCWDFVFTKGVLIHINPEELPAVYDIIYNSSSHYILLAEYYNPTPVDIEYRGHLGKLFKRDFAGEMLDAYPDLSLVDYGFIYHRDPNFPMDDINWFLMEK